MTSFKQVCRATIILLPWASILTSAVSSGSCSSSSFCAVHRRVTVLDVKHSHARSASVMGGGGGRSNSRFTCRSCKERERERSNQNRDRKEPASRLATNSSNAEIFRCFGVDRWEEFFFSSVSFRFLQLLSAAYLSVLAIIQPSSWFCLGVYRVLVLTATITAGPAHTGGSAHPFWEKNKINGQTLEGI